MANRGNRFRDAVIRLIESWNEPIEIKKEVPVGYRFVNTPREIDIVLKHKKLNTYLGIEAKIQETEGTAYQKLSYTLEDCLTSPITTLIVFSGKHIKNDMKSKLILSGISIELDFQSDDINNENDSVSDPKNLFYQRVCIELGLDWFHRF
ncbi:MAG: hypothetical protein KGZ79_08980 [Dethiobacter sp.]|jgi:hypothetical protein|nr:hypothetical protein [Dethiobacter sp.]